MASKNEAQKFATVLKNNNNRYNPQLKQLE